MTVTLADTPRFETERLILRAPEARDWETAAAFLVSDRARFIGGPYTQTAAWRVFGHAVGHWVLRGYGQFVLEEKASGSLLGSVGPWYPNGWAECELGWSLWHASAEGKGYACEAAERLRRFAYDDLGWTTAVSYIDADNARSIALAERLGCVRDREARLPVGEGSEDDATEVWVFRHPAPAEAAA
ncbi:GNAT family N-acetyltransferase [Rhodosalinus sp. K401]|uniref:GNAT family N-acetyltransferase n=1 Tax=Rhodosalinus sp. K401 TaxID=3239195 RepID=UPI003523F8A6